MAAMITKMNRSFKSVLRKRVVPLYGMTNTRLRESSSQFDLASRGLVEWKGDSNARSFFVVVFRRQDIVSRLYSRISRAELQFHTLILNLGDKRQDASRRTKLVHRVVALYLPELVHNIQVVWNALVTRSFVREKEERLLEACPHNGRDAKTARLMRCQKYAFSRRNVRRRRPLLDDEHLSVPQWTVGLMVRVRDHRRQPGGRRVPQDGRAEDLVAVRHAGTRLWKNLVLDACQHALQLLRRRGQRAWLRRILTHDGGVRVVRERRRKRRLGRECWCAFALALC